MLLFKQFLTGAGDVAVKVQAAITNSVNSYHEIALKSYSAVVHFLLDCYFTNDNTVKIDAEVCHLRQGLMITARYAQKVWTVTVSSGLVYDEKSHIILFVEAVTNPIRMTLRHWWSEHQPASLKHIT